jgi:hypothetical protein
METSVRVGSETPESDDVPVTPSRSALRTWAGHGTWATCNGCGGSVKPSEIEYEVELPPEPGSDVLTLHFHLFCYKDWTGRGAR